MASIEEIGDRTIRGRGMYGWKPYSTQSRVGYEKEFPDGIVRKIEVMLPSPPEVNCTFEEILEEAFEGLVYELQNEARS